MSFPKRSHYLFFRISLISWFVTFLYVSCFFSLVIGRELLYRFDLGPRNLIPRSYIREFEEFLEMFLWLYIFSLLCSIVAFVIWHTRISKSMSNRVEEVEKKPSLYLLYTWFIPLVNCVLPFIYLVKVNDLFNSILDDSGRVVRLKKMTYVVWGGLLVGVVVLIIFFLGVSSRVLNEKTALLLALVALLSNFIFILSLIRYSRQLQVVADLVFKKLDDEYIPVLQKGAEAESKEIDQFL